jgi:oligopeptide/dipeptide ABC transporter ATP-binding protein
MPDAPDPLVQMHDVRRVFRTPKGSVRAVDGVDLDLREAEAVAVVGESGSGKSTLARMMVGLDQPTSGAIRFRNLDLAAQRSRVLPQLHENVSIVFQDPYASLDPRLPVGQTIEEPLIVHKRGTRAERRERVDELLESVGLPAAVASRRPRALSGGERQRVAIARSIALNPQLVVLDEPTSALDVSVQAQVLNLLQDLRERLGLAYLFVSHDLAVVRHIAERVAVMYLGRVVEEGSTEQIFHEPCHPYTIALLSSALDVDDRNERRVGLSGDPPSPLHPPSGCNFRTRCFRARENCAHDDPALREFRDRELACHYPGPLETRDADGQGVATATERA